MAQNIEDIIFTDKKAREIVQKAQERRELILQAAEKERDRIIKDGQDKLEHLKASLISENEAYEKSLKQDIQKAYDEKKNVLLSRYEKDESKWTTEIFARITAKD